MKNINDHIDDLLVDYSKSKNRIHLIDYDGTLAPIQSHPELAAPSSSIKELLFRLGRDPANRVLIISGREKKTLENWLGDLPVTLVAEHGGFYKEPDQGWQSFFPDGASWKEKAHPAIQALVFRFTGSFMEEKHYSIVWHYRAIDNAIPE